MIKSWFITDYRLHFQTRSFPIISSPPNLSRLMDEMDTFEELDRELDARFRYEFDECEIINHSDAKQVIWGANKQYITYQLADTSEYRHLITYKAVLTGREDPCFGLGTSFIGFYATFTGSIDEYILYKLAKTD